VHWYWSNVVGACLSPCETAAHHHSDTQTVVNCSTLSWNITLQLLYFMCQRAVKKAKLYLYPCQWFKNCFWWTRKDVCIFVRGFNSWLVQQCPWDSGSHVVYMWSIVLPQRVHELAKCTFAGVKVHMWSLRYHCIPWKLACGVSFLDLKIIRLIFCHQTEHRSVPHNFQCFYKPVDWWGSNYCLLPARWGKMCQKQARGNIHKEFEAIPADGHLNIMAHPAATGGLTSTSFKISIYKNQIFYCLPFYHINKIHCFQYFHCVWIQTSDLLVWVSRVWCFLSG
jgi:hypothetical protein